jgi:hypothetical protein
MFSYMAWWQPYLFVLGLCLISFGLGQWFGEWREKRYTRAWQNAATEYGVRSINDGGRRIPELPA